MVTGENEIGASLIQKLMQIKGMYSLWQSVHTTKKTTEVFGKKVVLLAGEKYLPLQLEDIQLQISPRFFFPVEYETGYTVVS